MRSLVRKKRADFDSPWKELLVSHFEACLEFFFPSVHALIDWTKRAEFLDKDLRKIERHAKLGHRHADILVQVHLKSGAKMRVLVHVEVQGQRDKNFPERLFIYYYRAFDRKNIPVITLAILADIEPCWRPEKYESLHAGRGVRFDFHVCKITDFRSRYEELENSTKPFAIAIRAVLKTLETIHDPKARERWKVEFAKLIEDGGLSAEYANSLLHILDWFMVLPEKLDDMFEQKMEQFREEKKMRFVSTWERMGLKRGRMEGLQEGLQKGLQKGLHKGLQEGHQKGLQKGVEKGRVETARESVLVVLEGRFGTVPVKTKRAVNRVDDPKVLKQLLKWALNVESVNVLPEI